MKRKRRKVFIIFGGFAFVFVIVILLNYTMLLSLIDKMKSNDAFWNIKEEKGSEETAGADAGWQNAYEIFLEDLYHKNQDADTVYTYKEKIVKIGRYDFESGTTRFFVSDNDSCPGIFTFSVGGRL